MRIITLGTGAGRPTLHRLTSAVAVEYEGDSLLFDCGEGTQVQLMRSALKWGRIKAIFLGHLHGDHLNGLPGLLGTFSLSDRTQPLKVFGPKGLKAYLELLFQVKSLWVRFPMEIVEIREPGILLKEPTYQIETAPLDHTIECWGFAFHERDRPGKFNRKKAERLGVPSGPLRARLVQGEAISLENGRVITPQELVGPPRPGRRVVFCWDTKPCKNAVQFAQGADLLIHESTFDESFAQEAHNFGHSTAADAARTAQEAGAHRLLLTHISQRYLDEKLLTQEAQGIFPAAAVAFDLDEFFVPMRERE